MDKTCVILLGASVPVRPEGNKMVSTLHQLIYFRYLHGLFNRLYLIYRIQTLTYLDDRSIQEDEKGEANVMYSQSTFDNLASGKYL